MNKTGGCKIGCGYVVLDRDLGWQAIAQKINVHSLVRGTIIISYTWKVPQVIITPQTM